jgi:8-oxo-dGTP pyrophosphatase MutT (NUDIX family)
MKSLRTGNRQYAALPVRLIGNDDPEVMLITSRETRRWVLPKGWPMRGCTAAEAAQIEAFEEAGLTGDMIGRRPVGTYRYQKTRPAGEPVELRVDVYLMLVRAQLDDWPEKDERDTRWFTATEAAGLVAEKALDKIIRKIPAMKRRKKLRRRAGAGDISPA